VIQQTGIRMQIRVIASSSFVLFRLYHSKFYTSPFIMKVGEVKVGSRPPLLLF
jgi:hypothetical protein